uniref:Uncharacterized protein n=1 Tax=Rhizophora mucronata TaxID=61149 RepID=A0A2P2QUM2_RHIMU
MLQKMQINTKINWQRIEFTSPTSTLLQKNFALYT